jgi:hypothetical protein
MPQGKGMSTCPNTNFYFDKHVFLVLLLLSFHISYIRNLTVLHELNLTLTYTILNSTVGNII